MEEKCFRWLCTRMERLVKRMSTLPQRTDVFDVVRHRANANYGRKETVLRLCWALVQPWLWAVPRVLYGVRNSVLRSFGAYIGAGVRIYPSVRIVHPWNLRLDTEVTIGESVLLYCLGPIEIGAGTMVSQRTHLCAGTHDYLRPNLPLIKKGIRVGEGSWVCADAFIGPGCEIGSFSIVGARAVVLKSFPPCSILGGNPARHLKNRPVPSYCP